MKLAQRLVFLLIRQAEAGWIDGNRHDSRHYPAQLISRVR